MNIANLIFKTAFLYHLHEYQMHEVTCIEVLAKDYYFYIKDNGRGMGADRMINEVPYIELLLTQIQNPFQGEGETNIRLSGLGLGLLCSFTSSLTITSVRNQNLYRQTYEYSNPVKPIEMLGETEQSGTKIEVKLNPELVQESLNLKEIEQFLNQVNVQCGNLELYFNHQHFIGL